MEANRHLILFVGVLVFAVIAAFSPWGEIPISGPNFGNALAGSGLHGFNFPVARTMTVDAFNGHFTLLGIKTPNWLVALLTCFGAGLAMMRVNRLADVPTGVILVLFAVPSVFLVFAFVAFASNSGAAVGIGIPILLAANAIGIFACLKMAAEASRNVRRVRRARRVRAS